MISKLLSMTSVVTAIIHNENSTHTSNSNVTSLNHFNSQCERLANGIFLHTCYRISEIEKIESFDNSLILIKLLNPLGLSTDYIGSWSKESNEWSRLSTEEKARFACKEGEFWMSYDDFMKTFTHLEVIHLDSETSKDEPSLRGKTSWFIKLWRGVWRKGVTAGGCRNHVQSFHTNPQLLITLNHSDTLIICLNQHSIMEPKVIGFSLYHYLNTNCETKEARLDKSFFKKNRSIYNSLYTNSKQISMRCQSDVGKYVLIPTSYEPGQEGQFTIRIYSTRSIKLAFLDSLPLLIKSPIIKAPASFDYKFGQYETLFLEIADEVKKKMII